MIFHHSLYLPTGSSRGVPDPERDDPFWSYLDGRPPVFRCKQFLRLSYYGKDAPPPTAPALTRKEEMAAFRRYRKRRNARDRETLVRQYLCWAFGLAARYKGPRLAFDEAIGAANLGLVEAIEGYNPARGFRFTTYAAWIVRRKLIEAIVNTYPVKVSDHVRKKWKHLEENPEQLAAGMQDNEPRTAAEFFERLGETVDLSSAEVHERPDSAFLPSAPESPADAADQESRTAALRAAIEKLEPLEKETILARHYREPAESYEHLGKRLRVSKNRAREAYESAVVKLRRHFQQDT